MKIIIKEIRDKNTKTAKKIKIIIEYNLCNKKKLKLMKHILF